MKKPLRCIMLVDDDPNDNYYHKREIEKTNPSIAVIEKLTGIEALEYLSGRKEKNELLPDLILLDINMPVMDGWQFLNAFSEMEKDFHNSMLIIMLSTSGDPDDIEKTKKYSFVSDFISKPLTREIVCKIVSRYFSQG